MDGGDVGGVVVHVVAIADLARSSVPTPVMGDDPIPILQKEEHLGIPIVTRSAANHDETRRAARLVDPSP